MINREKNMRFFKLLLIAAIITIFSIPVFGQENIASVNGKYYTTVQDAVNHMKSGQTLVLLNDLKTSETVKINLGKKKICINFNEKKYLYTGYASAFDISSGQVTVKNMNIRVYGGAYAFYIKKGAALKINSGRCSGDIENYGTCTILSGNFSLSEIYNYKNLTIKNGVFSGTKSVSCYFVLTGKGGKSVISGGTFKNLCKDGSVSSFCVLKGGSLIIKGGKFTSNGDRDFYLIENKSGSLRFDGGNLKKKDGYCIYNLKGNMTINKLTLEGRIYNETSGKKKCVIKKANIKGSIYNSAGKMIINGGKYVSRKNMDEDCVLNGIKGDLTITNGTFIQTDPKELTDLALDTYGKVRIDGGTFKRENSGEAAIGLRRGSDLFFDNSLHLENNIVGLVSPWEQFMGY